MAKLRIFEITEKSFFSQIVAYFNEMYDKEKKEKYFSYSAPSEFFDKFTLSQLDLFKQLFTAKGVNVQQKEE